MPGLLLTGPEDTIDVRVVANATDHEVVFKLRKHTHLHRLIEAFHAHRRQPAGTYTLFYNSHEVNPADTPDSLRMQGLDYLQAVPNPALATFLEGRPGAHPESYYVTVLDTEFSRAEYLFRLRCTTKMAKLMDTYCARIGALPQERSFYYDTEAIHPDDTAESLGMNRPGFAYLVISTPSVDSLPLDSIEEK